MARKTKADRAVRTLTCERSGKTFEYVGYGRPPKYCPDVAKDVAREKRLAAYDARQRGKGKSPRRRAA